MKSPLIAILDDEPAIRNLLADALREAGFRTIGFSRATEFEAALKSTTPDVCLVDLGLPDRDGLSLVHLPRQTGPSPSTARPSRQLGLKSQCKMLALVFPAKRCNMRSIRFLPQRAARARGWGCQWSMI